ncbi:hypothetical protein R3P38DRAFT_3274236 [Favolaschia claudopus]|uniref:Uncharacterized protein n=1 Tax=Favolaschia claudopus TaxID=2862362 RepID=A0AAW0B0M4_9AGAR
MTYDCNCRRPPRAQNAINRPGDVCTVRYASAELPFMELMVEAVNALPRAQRPQKTKEMRDRLDMLKDRSQHRGKPHRPCIVLSPDDGQELDEAASKVCLMATFEGKPIQSMPELIREVVLPVYQEASIASQGAAIPGRSAQWIIPLPIVPPHGHTAALPLWKPSQNPRSRGRHFDQAELRQLEDIVESTKLTWRRRLLKDPSLLTGMYDEIRASPIPASLATASMMNCSMLSMTSTRTNISRTSRVAPLVAPVGNNPFPDLNEANFPSLASTPSVSTTPSIKARETKTKISETDINALGAGIQKVLRIKTSSSRLSIRTRL